MCFAQEKEEKQLRSRGAVGGVEVGLIGGGRGEGEGRGRGGRRREVLWAKFLIYREREVATKAEIKRNRQQRGGSKKKIYQDLKNCKVFGWNEI